MSKITFSEHNAGIKRALRERFSVYLLLITCKKRELQLVKRIQKGVIKPNDPKENGTMGGTGPLKIDAACTVKSLIARKK